MRFGVTIYTTNLLAGLSTIGIVVNYIITLRLAASSVSTLSCKQPQLLSEPIVVNQSRSMVVKGNVVGEGEVISCSVPGQIQ